MIDLLQSLLENDDQDENLEGCFVVTDSAASSDLVSSISNMMVCGQNYKCVNLKRRYLSFVKRSPVSRNVCQARNYSATSLQKIATNSKFV